MVSSYEQIDRNRKEKINSSESIEMDILKNFYSRRLGCKSICSGWGVTLVIPGGPAYGQCSKWLISDAVEIGSIAGLVLGV